MKLLIVICNYRVTDLTIDCLRSLASRIGRVPGARVAVCENGTGPEDAERLRRVIADNGWESWVELHVVYPNRGFTGGNNVVLRQALASPDPPEYFMLLNADTIVLDETLEPLVAFMDRTPAAGIVGGALVWPGGEVYGPPFRFPGVRSELERGLHLGLANRLLQDSVVLVRPIPSVATRADWISGASMILRRSMLEQIGLLDEGLFTYYDDVEISMRARRAGWETWYVPESKVIHLEGKSTGVGGTSTKRNPPYWYQARRRYLLMSLGSVRAACADAAFILGFAFHRFRRWALRRPDLDPPHMLWDSIRHSVFFTGFRVTEVENPAMPGQPTP